MIKIVMLLSSIFALLSLSAEAKNLYVNGSVGNDSVTYANNSSSTPWRTIGRAAWGSTNRANPNTSEAAIAGDTVYIESGIYSEPSAGNERYNPVFSPVNSGTSGNRITFQAEGRVELQLSSGLGSIIGVSAYDSQLGGAKSYVTFKGFTIYEVNAPTGVDCGLVMIAGGNGNTIENCTLVGNVNSSVRDNHSGIWLTGDTGTTIRNNYISNFLNAGAYHHNAPGIMFYETTSAIIEHNEISNCGSGVFIKGWDNNSNTVRYNYISGCGSGVKIATAIGTHKVYQNIIIGRSGGTAGLSCHPMVENGIRGTVYLVNNTLIDSFLHWPWSINSTASFYSYNNIIAYLSGSSYGVEAAYWDRLTQLYFDYNIYYNVASWYSYNNQQHTSISSWRSVVGGCPNSNNDCSSITNNPLFVNASQRDYHLQSNSSARSLGVDILNLAGMGSSARIPAGAYISGEEVIGSGGGGESGSPSAPIGLRIVN